MKLQKMVEGRMHEMKAKRARLAQQWSPYIREVNEWKKEKEGRELTLMEKNNIAQALENALVDGGYKQGNRLFETTAQDNITFLGVVA